jgi:RNA polymerase sigma-70 factor, ECF subfamily
MTMTAIDTRRRSVRERGREVVQYRSSDAPNVRRHADPRQHARPTMSNARGLSDPFPGADDLGGRLAAGDTEALRDVYSRYGGPMLTAALHHLDGDRRLAEEAVQAAMLKAWRAAPTFNTTRPLAPWLYSIVRNCAIDLRRHERRHQRASLDTMDRELASGGNDAFESAATAWAVRAALEQLAAKEYAVMRLTYFEGLTQGEIAARLGVPLGTVKTRSARAHHRLRVVLDSQVTTGRSPERRGRPIVRRD